MAEVVYTRIAADLRARIDAGEFVPGELVPTEADLAARWRTSRGPVRNALATLRAEGLIETSRGRPARVAAPRVTQPADASVPFTRWARAIGAEPGARTQSVTLRPAGAERARLLEVDPATRVVSVLRLRLLDGQPAMLERLTYLAEVGRSLLDVDLDAVSISEHLEARGYASGTVDHQIDAVAADSADAELLGLPIESPLLRLSRIRRDGTGRVFEASDDRYLPSVIRFTVSAWGRSRADATR